MKVKFLFLFLGLTGTVQAQTLAEADRQFDRFEYASAARSYEEVAKVKKLDVESRKKLAYSYYASGEYAKCYPVVDSLIKLQGIETYFIFMHANVAMEQGKYDESKASFENYRSKDNEFNVDLLIQSCDSLKIWTPNEKVSVHGNEGNISKADINGGAYKNGYFAFRESGIDSIGTVINNDAVDMGELVLSQPYLISETSDVLKISLPSEYKLAAITSVASFPGTDQFLITLTQPSHKDELQRAPHLYTATLTDNAFTNIVPWIYSGLEDTTGCGYATVNAKGDRIVFSKQGRTTNGSDLYMSSKLNEGWSTPIKIDALNTDYDEVAPMFTGDSVLSFSSNGRPGYGSLDIFTVSFDGNNFGAVEHPKAPLNSFGDDLNFTWINDTLALFTSNRGNGKGDDDIYSMTVPKIVPPAVDSTDNELEQYLASWTDKKILFDYDKYSIKDQKTIEDIADALKKFNGLKIVIEGHTDIRGNEFYNIELGKQRAQTVRNEFMKLGVNGDNIEIISKGEREALVDCSKGCSEEQHQQNRVAIIKIKN